MKQPLYIRPSQFEVLEDRIAPATIVVTNLDNDGAGSLRDAVMQANMSGGTDTIKFQKGLEGTITLATDIAIEESVKIVGPGIDKIAVSGNNAVRIFNISDGDANTLQTISISGLGFVNGSSANGGAIFTEESLILDKTAFTSNSASSNGGAIFSRSGGDFIMKNSTVSGNEAAATGGGVYVYSLGPGGQIVNSVISANNANSGGGLFLYGNAAGVNFLLSKTTVSNNIATGVGGGILSDLDSGTLTIKSSSITGNSSANGGGLYFDDGTLVVDKSTFSENNSTDSGGAITASSVLQVTIKSSNIVGNNAANDGGGLSLRATANGTTIISSTITGNSAGDMGGGIFAENETLDVKSCKLIANFASNFGGGIRSEGGGVLNLTKTAFSFNHSNSAGGGVSTNGMAANAIDLNVVSSTFTANKSAHGGGIDTVGDGVIAISGSKFIENIASTDDGGAMYLRTSTTATITGSLFQKNSASDDAGAVALYDSANTGTAVISKSKFFGNTAEDTGGAINVFQSFASAVISGSTIQGNVAGGIGGGLYAAANATVENSKITGNLAPTAPNSNV